MTSCSGLFKLLSKPVTLPPLGPDVWVYRWRELQEDGTRVQRKKTIGDVKEFPKKDDVKREVENLRPEINAQQDISVQHFPPWA
jgi:hypothetical protein